MLTSLASVQQLKSGSHNDRQVIISVTCPGTTEPRSCHTVRHLTCATARQRRLLDAWAVAGTPQGSAATPSRSKPCTWCLPPVPRSPRPRPLCACPASSSAGAPVARFKAIADSTLPAGLDRAEVPAQGIRCIDTFVGPQGGGYPSNSAEQLRRPFTAHLRKAADCASRRANSRGLPRTRHRLTGRCGGHQACRAAARQSLWASQSLARAGHRTESLSCNLPMSCWTQLVTRFDVKVIPHHALRVSL